MELHGFRDSSKEVYCVVIYVRSVVNEDVKVNFLVAKTKLAPLIKTLSIPRLELLGCLLSSKLINEVTTAFPGHVVVEDIFCWTDSRVVLSWIWSKEKQWEAWLENRVVNIRKIVDRTKLHFVRGDENPADIPMRIASNLGECFAGSWFSGLPLKTNSCH